MASYQMDTRQPNHPVPLSFVDFTPKCLKKRGMITMPVYEPFPALMEQANNWLRQHPDMYVKTCESIESYNDIGIDTLVGSYQQYPYGHYNRSLRLWIAAKDESMDRSTPQQIGYINIVPECTDKGGIFSAPQFEPFNITMDKANDFLRSQPLQGRILTLETQDTFFERWDSNYDPDATAWFQRGGKSPIYYWLWIMRIFYEVGPPAYETIGCADFMPGVVKEGGTFTSACYEPLSQVGVNANTWIQQQRDIRVTNVQTVNYKAHSSWSGQVKSLDSMRTFYHEREKGRNAFIRIMRVCFVRSTAYDATAVRQPNLNFKTFVVGLKKSPGCMAAPVTEIQPDIMKRMQAWLGYAGCRVVSAETIRLESQMGRHDETGEVPITWNEARVQYVAYALRVFFDGEYREPPPGVLPPMPALEDSSCCIIM